VSTVDHDVFFWSLRTGIQALLEAMSFYDGSVAMFAPAMPANASWDLAGPSARCGSDPFFFDIDGETGDPLFEEIQEIESPLIYLHDARDGRDLTEAQLEALREFPTVIVNIGTELASPSSKTIQVDISRTRHSGCFIRGLTAPLKTSMLGLMGTGPWGFDERTVPYIGDITPPSERTMVHQRYKVKNSKRVLAQLGSWCQNLDLVAWDSSEPVVETPGAMAFKGKQITVDLLGLPRMRQHEQARFLQDIEDMKDLD